MKISVITVSFNAADSIQKTLDSIFSQTWCDIESIIIDGASTDGTIEIIEKYKDKISKFISEPDSGIYNAMNKGIDCATGDYIFFLNARDVFYDNMVIEKIVNAIEICPKAEFVFGNILLTNGKIVELCDASVIKTTVDMGYRNICQQAIFYKKTLFEKFGNFDESIRIYADWVFNIKVLVVEKVLALHVPSIICEHFLVGKKPFSNELQEQFMFDLRAKNRMYKNSSKIATFDNFLSKNFNSIHKQIFSKILFKLLFSTFIKLNLAKN